MGSSFSPEIQVSGSIIMFLAEMTFVLETELTNSDTYSSAGMDGQLSGRLTHWGGFPPQIAGLLSLSFLCFSSALTIKANKTAVEMIALNE